MSQALYRKYRSKNLDEVLGQEHVTSLLKRAVAQQKTAHAYLLTGPRGTGKTSVARILAHEITGLDYSENGEHLDIIEIDAASNNGVDDVRDLREKALIAPSLADKKVYIIDEVHMLSKPAFNALLKLMEEPPAHVVFILATTDFDKVPDTIISRTQRYNFRLVDEATVAKHLSFIAEREGIEIDSEALDLIAERGGGSFRDSISLLDQIQHSKATGTIIKRGDIEVSLGLASSDEIEAIIHAVNGGEPSQIIAALQQPEQRGVSPLALAAQLHAWIRKSLNSQPQLVYYLEGLAEVAKSHHPDIKLLITMLKFADTPNTKQAKYSNQDPPNPPVSPVSDTPLSSSSKASEKPIQTANQPEQKPSQNQTKAEEAKEDVHQKLPEPELTKKPTSSPEVSNSTEISLASFTWQAVMDKLAEQDKESFSGLKSLLAKSSSRLEGNLLTLYVGNKFNKNQIDKPKYRSLLSQILAKVDADQVEIQTVASPPPPKNEQAAKVAAIMGGGEEVDV